ncbi:unnamed protein product [Echinostoma caproni]|uniref:Uncharacterized protein n=1 Tax=Echinostoma caproni TaxID=27848 RepID=A0A183AVW0_9TREM|nr:unnamed protein product [Echinostoma caproni]
MQKLIRASVSEFYWLAFSRVRTFCAAWYDFAGNFACIVYFKMDINDIKSFTLPTTDTIGMEANREVSQICARLVTTVDKPTPPPQQQQQPGLSHPTPLFDFSNVPDQSRSEERILFHPDCGYDSCWSGSCILCAMYLFDIIVSLFCS